MAGNYLSDSFLESLLNVFGPDASLEELNLFGNRITDHGLGLIIQRIPRWKYLRRLAVGQNMFYPAAAERLLELLKTNYTLVDVTIRSFDDERLDKIQDQIDHYCRLNKGGRRIKNSDKSTIPLSLWPLLLERALRVFASNENGDNGLSQSVTGAHSHSFDAMFCLLKGPAIFENPRIMDTM